MQRNAPRPGLRRASPRSLWHSSVAAWITVGVGLFGRVAFAQAAPAAQAPVAQAPVAQAPVAQAPVAQAPVAQGDDRTTGSPSVIEAPEIATGSPATAVPQPVSQPSPPRPLASLPATVSYHGEGVPPEGYVLGGRARKGLLIPGISVLAAGYLSAVMPTGIAGFPNKTGFLAIPVVGPWITLLARDNSCSESSISLCDSEEELVERLLIVDGIAQGAGLALTIVGFVWKQPVWVRQDIAEVRLVPGLVAPNVHGASLVGRF